MYLNLKKVDMKVLWEPNMYHAATWALRIPFCAGVLPQRLLLFRAYTSKAAIVAWRMHMRTTIDTKYPA